MNSNILKALNIEAEESKGVFLLISQSIFIGIFYGAYEIAANSLFLDYFEPSVITKAYAVSGLAGIALTAVYSALQEKIKFSNLAIINLLFIGILTALIRFSFGIISVKIIAFILLVIYGPLRIIALVGFWGSVGRLFSLRQGKRLFGLIDSGWILGIIISCYGIPILLKFNFQTNNLLYISTASILLALLLQTILGRSFNLNPVSEGTEEVKLKERKLTEMVKNPYIRSMAIFVVLSMITAFFVQYSFIYATKDNYPGSTEFSMFYSFYTGTMMIFILLIKTFVYSRLIKTYGLKVALIVSPLLLILFSSLAAIIGSFFGYTSASPSFAFFFLLIALTKLFASALKDGIEVPSFKILYQSIDKAIRHAIQAKIDGTVNEIAALFSGVLLASLTLLPFFKILHFSYFLVIILVIWVYVATKLYIQYQKSLQSALSKEKTSISPHDEILQPHLEIVKNRLENKSDSNEILLLKAVELIDPIEYEEHLITNIGNHNKNINFYISEIERLKIFIPESSVGVITKKGNDELKNKLKSIQHLILEPAAKISLSEIKTLANSAIKENKLKACRLIKYAKIKESDEFLTKLLRDFDRQIKIEAIKASAYVYNSEIISLIIDLIDEPIYAPFVTAALKKIGKESVDLIEQTFYKSDVNTDTLIKLIKLFGYLKVKRGVKSLINSIDHVNREVQYQSVVSLLQNNFTLDETNTLHIHESIEKLIGIIAWNIAALASLEDKNVKSFLTEALNEELKLNHDKLFLLLSIAYDKSSIDNVRENLESETAEGIGFGIELLDQFVSDELKNILFPILDDSSKTDKIKQLQNQYPVDKTEDLQTLFIDIINRDVNQINFWTKACAIFELDKLENLEINDALIAQLFNPDPLLNSMTASLIIKRDKKIFDSCILRIDSKIKEQLIYKLFDEKAEYIPEFDQVLFFKEQKNTSLLSGNSIYKLIRNSTYKHTNEITKIKLNGKRSVLFIYEGEINLYENNKQLKKTSSNGVINLFNYIGESNYEIELLENTKYFEIEDVKLSKLIYEDYNILNLFINS